MPLTTHHSPLTISSLADWLSWQESLHPNPIDLGLTRFNRTLHALKWRRPACPVITVAGTNGKGSSVALLNRMLTCASYRVGTFTSPHLLRYNERITVADEAVSDASLVAAFERIDRARGADTLTFFEFNALAALLVFETACLDVIVLEVGLGGRLDAVNAVDCDVALVTSIALDHCAWLGNDLDTIGREKAGIFRNARPAVFGSRDMPNSIATVASETGAGLLRLGVDFDYEQGDYEQGDYEQGDYEQGDYERGDYERGDRRWSWRAGDSLGKRHIEDLPWPALIGDIQFDNAAAVLAVLTTLHSRLPVSEAAIRQGLSTVSLPGRFQQLMVSGVPWILDVAHNPAAAHTLATQLAATRGAHGGRTIAVCGILGDKDIEGVLNELLRSVDQWLVAGLPGARAVPAEALADRLQRGGAQEVASDESVAAACDRACALAGPGDRVVVFGSFLTVGGALDWLASRGQSIL